MKLTFVLASEIAGLKQKYEFQAENVKAPPAATPREEAQFEGAKAQLKLVVEDLEKILAKRVIGEVSEP